MTASFIDEESPSITGQWRWVTPTEGDFKDSATEINRKVFDFVRVERRGKSAPAVRRRNWLCKPRLMQDTGHYGRPARPQNRLSIPATACLDRWSLKTELGLQTNSKKPAIRTDSGFFYDFIDKNLFQLRLSPIENSI